MAAPAPATTRAAPPAPLRPPAGTILLYQAPNLFNFLPRGVFGSDEDWRRAQDLVREKVRVP